MTVPKTRRGRRLVVAGLVGAALAPTLAPVRRVAAARALRLRALLGDPVAPFMNAPCHQGAPDGATQQAVAGAAGLPA